MVVPGEGPRVGMPKPGVAAVGEVLRESELSPWINGKILGGIATVSRRFCVGVFYRPPVG
jgi:hypothetical protein